MVAKLKVLCEEDPDLFIHAYHWVPIERWVPATDEDMERVASELGEGIQEEEGWMMHLHKRHHGGHSQDLIKKLTDPINRGSVSLKNPDRILAVEILGDRAGLSLLGKKELLDTNRLRQKTLPDKCSRSEDRMIAKKLANPIRHRLKWDLPRRSSQSSDIGKRWLVPSCLGA